MDLLQKLQTLSTGFTTSYCNCVVNEEMWTVFIQMSVKLLNQPGQHTGPEGRVV